MESRCTIGFHVSFIPCPDVMHTIRKIDRGSIRSSPRNGLSTLHRLSKEECGTVLPYPCLHLVHPALNLFVLDAGILILVQRATSKYDDVLLDHGGLPYVLPLAVHLKLVCWSSRGDHSKMFLLLEFI